jgi:hypothetical protein
MPARKPSEPDTPLPDPDDILRVMLNTPPRPHTVSAPPAKRKQRPAQTKKPAK